MQFGKLPQSHISGHGSAILLFELMEKRQVQGVTGELAESFDQKDRCRFENGKL